jgi:hypothetical protein
MAVLTTNIVKRELRSGKSVIQIADKYKVTRQAVYCHINKLKKRKRNCKTRLKKNYNHLIDWRIYNEGLVKRGEFLLDFDLFKDWAKELKGLNATKRGRPYKYPESFILFFARLKSVFRIDYRTLEGVARKLVLFIPEAKGAPDYTTFQVRLSRSKWKLEVYGLNEQQDIAGDGSGLKTTNRGEYRISRYRGKRKKFVKLHLAVNVKNKQVLYCNATCEQLRDGEELLPMILSAKRYGKVNNGYFDAAYDWVRNYEASRKEGINPVIRPRRSLSLSRVRKKIRQIEKGGVKGDKLKARLMRLKVLEEFLTDEQGWKKRTGYGKRWAVEDRYSVFKRTFSEHVYSKKLGNIQQEVVVKASLMNLFTYISRGETRHHI